MSVNGVWHGGCVYKQNETYSAPYRHRSASRLGWTRIGNSGIVGFRSEWCI